MKKPFGRSISWETQVKSYISQLAFPVKVVYVVLDFHD